MEVEPYTIPNYAKSKTGLQIDIGLLTKDEFESYCNSIIKKLKINYNIRKKALKSKSKRSSE